MEEVDEGDLENFDQEEKAEVQEGRCICGHLVLIKLFNYLALFIYSKIIWYCNWMEAIISRINAKSCSGFR